MEEFVRSHGTNIWTEISGENRRGYILLCSGGPGCPDYLRPVAEMLADEYSIIRFEQRGCGRSDADGNYGLETALDDIEAIRKHYGVERWIVGGHSWGANLALCCALRYPEQAEAVLYIAGNGFQNNRDWSEEYHANRTQHGEESPELPYPPNAEVNRMGNATFRKFIQGASLYRELSQLEMPALFLCGREDIRPSWPVEQISCLMRRGHLVFIEDAAHFIWLRQPARMKAELRSFLQLPGSR